MNMKIYSTGTISRTASNGKKKVILNILKFPSLVRGQVVYSVKSQYDGLLEHMY